MKTASPQLKSSKISTKSQEHNKKEEPSEIKPSYSFQQQEHSHPGGGEHLKMKSNSVHSYMRKISQSISTAVYSKHTFQPYDCDKQIERGTRYSENTWITMLKKDRSRYLINKTITSPLDLDASDKNYAKYKSSSKTELRLNRTIGCKAV